MVHMGVLSAVRIPGLTPYEVSYGLQRRLVDARREGKVPDILLLLEHPSVYTIGRAGSKDEVLIGQDACRRRGVEVHFSDRGGRVTYHGPGQLVGYGITDLYGLGVGVRRYIRCLEDGLIAALSRFGITSRTEEGLTGVWVGDEKIAAIGIRVTRGITMHGFALNVDPDLSFFRDIVPCGITERGVTSMRRVLGAAPSIDDVAVIVAEEVATALGRELVWKQDLSALLSDAVAADSYPVAADS